MLNIEPMIITCPACATRYEVSESAIGGEGRTVRCANCRHSWLQELAPDAPTSAADQADTGPDAGLEMATESETETETLSPPAITEPAMTQLSMTQPVIAPGEAITEAAPGDAAQAGTVAPFDYQPPFDPPRGRVRMWVLAIVVFVLFAAGIAAASVAWYGIPDWVPLPRQSLGRVAPGLVLDFAAKRMDRRTLANGTEFFGASGTVTNVGAERRTVPPIEIVMRDSRRHVVYRREVIPPRRHLGPGESMTINEAMTDIPRSAIVSEIGWKAT